MVLLDVWSLEVGRVSCVALMLLSGNGLWVSEGGGCSSGVDLDLQVEKSCSISVFFLCLFLIIKWISIIFVIGILYLLWISVQSVTRFLERFSLEILQVIWDKKLLINV